MTYSLPTDEEAPLIGRRDVELLDGDLEGGLFVRCLDQADECGRQPGYLPGLQFLLTHGTGHDDHSNAVPAEYTVKPPNL